MHISLVVHPILLSSRPISRVLYPLWGVCHSSMLCITAQLKRSTLRLGRAALKRRYTRTCSFQDTRLVRHRTTGGLLPHLLTLTLNNIRRSFSSAWSNPHGLLPVKKWNALCCPDFPQLTCVSSDKPVNCFLFRRQNYAFFMSLQNNMVNECKKRAVGF